MEAICPICGVEFEKKTHIHIYCSRKCYKKSDKNKEINKKYNEKHKKPRQKRICPKCKIEFIKTYNNQVYCSRECFNYMRKESNAIRTQKYSKTERGKEYMRNYQRKYFYTEKCQERLKKQREILQKYQKCQSINLTDNYIKKNLKCSFAPKELIEAKREQLKLFRLIRQMS